MDVKSALRQVGVAPGLVAAFAYRLEDRIFVHLQLHFGWRGSSGWLFVVASAIQDAHRVTWASAGTSTTVNESTSHMGVAESTGKAVEPLPPAYRVPRVQHG